MENIKQLVFRLGIRSTYNGFHYLCYALYLCLQDENYLLSVYKCLYTAVARHFGVNRGGVEHCIRTVVSVCWYKGDRDFLVKLSGYGLSQKPTNGEFIDILYHHLSTQ